METIKTRLRSNWKSGLTVALVSIPLSISLAIASGTTPIVGIITAIWAGLFASIFGGSNFNIVGPTGALSGLILAYILANGTASIGSLTVLVGLIVLVSYFLKLERYLILIPSSVIHGFTLGVAFIIGLGQLNFALGLKNLPKHSELFQNIIESLKHIAQVSLPAVILFALSMAMLILLKKYVKKIPGAIILAPIGILVGYLSSAKIVNIDLATILSNFGEMDAKIFAFPNFAYSHELIFAAFTIALIAILETMLSARIADAMTKTKHNERKEMLGLSLANIASGLAGGIPATAALARTSLNIKSGADDKMSATISSILIVVISLVLFKYFKFMPMAVIAAILVDVAIKMVETEHFVRFLEHDKKAFYLSMAVAFVTVYKDPIDGILLGTAISLLIFVDKLSQGQYEVIDNKTGVGKIDPDNGKKISEIEENPDILLYAFKGRLVYLNCRSHVARFEAKDNFQKYKTIILRMRGCPFMDLDGIDAFDEIVDIVEERGQQIIITSIDPTVKNFLATISRHFPRLEDEGKVFEKTTFALKHLGIPADKI